MWGIKWCLVWLISLNSFYATVRRIVTMLICTSCLLAKHRLGQNWNITLVTSAAGSLLNTINKPLYIHASYIKLVMMLIGSLLVNIVHNTWFYLIWQKTQKCLLLFNKTPPQKKNSWRHGASLEQPKLMGLIWTVIILSKLL